MRINAMQFWSMLDQGISKTLRGIDLQCSALIAIDRHWAMIWEVLYLAWPDQISISDQVLVSQLINFLIIHEGWITEQKCISDKAIIVGTNWNTECRKSNQIPTDPFYTSSWWTCYWIISLEFNMGWDLQFAYKVGLWFNWPKQWWSSLIQDTSLYYLLESFHTLANTSTRCWISDLIWWLHSAKEITVLI